MSSKRARPDSVTSHDVARVAGVSQSTVSRVLRQDPRVRAQTRDRVLRALTQTRYEPNAAAQAFRTSRSGAIGVVVARLSYALFPSMLEAISAELARLGRRMIVWDAEHGGDLQASRALRRGIVDGVILTAATPDSEFLRDTASPNAPVVLLNRTVDGYPSDQVSSDNYGGGREVAAYLLGHARKRIALISGASRASTILHRERGFRDALAAAGAPLSPRYLQQVSSFSDAGHARGEQAAVRLLELGEPPDAIFCVNDILALGAIDAARSRGVRVPQDLWVIGYDDIEMASWAAFDLTTVRQPMPQMIDHAVARLLARIDDRQLPIEHRRFPNELVIRGSTGRSGVPDSAAAAGQPRQLSPRDPPRGRDRHAPSPPSDPHR
ncbi:MAG TPA: LacI family DNA-binding transcriptional regulator [Burkholderiaceae bacterium]|nr:LacI family DNA-binding transcriptional regulator [Burkholderiaceae bacterium]